MRRDIEELATDVEWQSEVVASFNVPAERLRRVMAAARYFAHHATEAEAARVAVSQMLDESTGTVTSLTDGIQELRAQHEDMEAHLAATHDRIARSAKVVEVLKQVESAACGLVGELEMVVTLGEEPVWQPPLDELQDALLKASDYTDEADGAADQCAGCPVEAGPVEASLATFPI